MILIALLLLSACTLLSESTPDEPAINVHDYLTAKLTETQQAQAAALTLWDRVILGDQVSCAESIPVPERASLSERDLRAQPDAGAIQAQLNAAIQMIHNSADLWNIECADARPYVPLNMAKEGHATARAASEPLAEAERWLAAGP